MHDRDAVVGKVIGELQNGIMSDLDAAPGREEHGDQQGVLLRNGAAELGNDPRGHTQLQADRIDMPAARSAARRQEHLVIGLVGHDLLDDPRQPLDPQVADRLPSDLQDLHIGE